MEPSSYPRPILDNIKDKHSKIPTLFSLSMPVLCVFLQILACFCEILNNFLYEFRKKMIKSFQKQLPSILKMLFPFKTTMNGQLGTFEVISLSFIIFIFVLVNLSMLPKYCTGGWCNNVARRSRGALLHHPTVQY